MPTAAIVEVACCAVTGNLITNEQSGGTQQLMSLVVYEPGHELSGAGVTGDIFRGTPGLPARPLQPPMDKWDILYTIL